MPYTMTKIIVETSGRSVVASGRFLKNKYADRIGPTIPPGGFASKLIPANRLALIISFLVLPKPKYRLATWLTDKTKGG